MLVADLHSTLIELTRELLDDGLKVELRVGGSSMSPMIRDGDVVTLAPRPCVFPRHGDVIAFVRREKWLVIHRVIGRRGSRISTRGDAAPGPDAPVVIDDMLAAVIRVERRGRPVRFGLGPERRIIASLSRWGLWRRLLAFARRFLLYS